MKVDQRSETNLSNAKDFLKGKREPNCVSNYIFHDQDIVYSLRQHAKRGKMVIQKETIYEDFS